MLVVDWLTIKAFADARKLPISSIDLGERLWLLCADGPIVVQSYIHKTAESGYLSTYNASYRTTGDLVQGPRNQDNRIVVHATPRKRGTFTHFTGASDSQVDQSAIGGSDGAVLA